MECDLGCSWARDPIIKMIAVLCMSYCAVNVGSAAEYMQCLKDDMVYSIYSLLKCTLPK